MPTIPIDPEYLADAAANYGLAIAEIRNRRSKQVEQAPPRKRRRKPEVIKWRDSQQIAGFIGRLTEAINTATNGATCEIDLKTARGLQEICRQAKHTEEGHEPTF